MNKDYTFIPFILNNLEKESDYNIDLYDLFGTEDGVQKGLVGKWDPERGDYKNATWDWGSGGFKIVIRILYQQMKKKKGEDFSFKDFGKFYEQKVKGNPNLLETLQRGGIFPNPCHMIYVIKYKKQFPGLLLEIENLSWKNGRIWITFKPIKYFMTDGEFWERIKEKIFLKGEYHQENWQNWLGVSNKFLNEFFKVDRYKIFRLIPLQIIDECKKDYRYPKIFYLKEVQKKQGVQFKDNQVFWSLFHHITGARQIIEDIELQFNHDNYQIKNLLINTLDKRNLVYKQEYGVPNVICNILLNKYGKKYLKEEFQGRKIRNLSDGSILKRAFKVGNIPGEQSNKFAESNYDYAVDLNPLGRKEMLLFDLTVGLWYKGGGEGLSYKEYLGKWRSQLFETVLKHNYLKLIWYVAIPETEKKFYEITEASHTSFQETLKEITKNLPLKGVLKVGNNNAVKTERIFVIPLFKAASNSSNVSQELNNLLADPKKTIFYDIANQIL